MPQSTIGRGVTSPGPSWLPGFLIDLNPHRPGAKSHETRHFTPPMSKTQFFSGNLQIRPLGEREKSPQSNRNGAEMTPNCAHSARFCTPVSPSLIPPDPQRRRRLRRRKFKFPPFSLFPPVQPVLTAYSPPGSAAGRFRFRSLRGAELLPHGRSGRRGRRQGRGSRRDRGRGRRLPTGRACGS